MLTIHYSNHLEALAAELAALMREPLASPFAGEIVIVQSRGVARWLSLELADATGVCANVRFPFPNAYVWTLYRLLPGRVPETSLFDPEILAWRIAGLLRELEARDAFAPVRNYVRGDALRRHELALRLAEVYDQYLVYRSDWIGAWEDGREAHWQAELWRRLSPRAGPVHRAFLHAALLAALDARSPGLTLPERISVFGALAVPPVLIELFAALARHVDVHLFLQNPCREYWGDIATVGEIARRALAGKPEAPLLDTGNSLLASLGPQGRDVLDLIAGLEGPVETKEHFVDPGESTLLAALQSDILALRERREPPVPFARDDASIQIHCCHSPMREAEVLHDQLLAIFAAHPDLEPSDVVVMTPDIETYAPYIEAVFSTAEPRIPFSVSDRSAERESTLAATFMALLELAGSRYDANRVLRLLDEPAVRRRFALTEGDLEVVQRWVHESGIRWGIDANHRARFGLPAHHEHTWRFGLDRLLLGFALPAGGAHLYAGILPYDEAEGSLGEVLGRFQSFAEAAIALDSELAEPRPVAAWAAALRRMLARFFDPEREREHELETLRSAVGALEMEASLAQYRESVPLTVIGSALRARLEVPGRAFLSGGVTFCAMMPMRSLPFGVVCMIGLNDGAYPRIRRPHGFDLMAGEFRRGDRSRREDDRYLFLESLICARRCLYVSYTGRNIRDDSVIPPSVLVSELIEHLERGYRVDGEAGVRAHLVTVHPLQAFSRRYFEGGHRLYSYSDALCRASAQAGRGTAVPAPFITTGLPALEPESRTIDADALIRFFRNPTRHLLEQRLKIRLATAEQELDAREPFTLNGLELYALKTRMLSAALEGAGEDGYALARAGGMLPHGRAGEVLYETQSDLVGRFLETLEPLLPQEVREPVSLDMQGEHIRLAATLTKVTAQGLVEYRPADIKPNDRLRAWIRHLVLNACAPAGVERITRCIAQDLSFHFQPVDDARERLAELLGLYWLGMHRPLRFFPRSAWAYAQAGSVTSSVRLAWEGSEREEDTSGECNDPYYRLAFRGADALDSEFERIATLVFAPLMTSSTERR
jgi:exodeoxyribonuclease V gamma subunit